MEAAVSRARVELQMNRVELKKKDNKIFAIIMAKYFPPLKEVGKNGTMTVFILERRASQQK
jgi:hypothetical protein